MELCDEEYYCCENCPQFYKMEWALKVHQKLRCGKVNYKPWKCECEGCGSVFAQELTLREHIGVVHLKKKPYTCTVCGEKFCKRAEVVNSQE